MAATARTARSGGGSPGLGGRRRLAVSWAAPAALGRHPAQPHASVRPSARRPTASAAFPAAPGAGEAARALPRAPRTARRGSVPLLTKAERRRQEPAFPGAGGGSAEGARAGLGGKACGRAPRHAPRSRDRAPAAPPAALETTQTYERLEEPAAAPDTGRWVPPERLNPGTRTHFLLCLSPPARPPCDGSACGAAAGRGQLQAWPRRLPAGLALRLAALGAPRLPRRAAGLLSSERDCALCSWLAASKRFLFQVFYECVICKERYLCS